MLELLLEVWSAQFELVSGEQEDAAAAVAWLEDIGALDDAAYAASVARHYAAMGYGPVKIRDEFYRRGVPKDLWDEA